MTDQKEPKIVARWIATTKDSVFISEDMLYYGKINPSKYDPKILYKLGSVPLSYLKALEIDNQKKTTTLGYGQSDATILIRWESMDSMNEFKRFLIELFPRSFILSREDKVKAKTRGTIAALIIIPLFYFILLVLGTFNSKTPWKGGSRTGSQAIVALFQALASMGVLKLTLLFGGFFGIALLALFRARKKSADITIIHLK